MDWNRHGGRRVLPRPTFWPSEVQAMSDENENDVNRHKNEMRAMWIFSAAVVLLIVGMMGANVLFRGDPGTGSPEISSQSRPAPTQ
jgi:hypothetical protein